MEIQKENHLLEQFEKTKTFKRFFSTLLRFDEELDCFISTEKWRDKEAELLTAAWWMFAEVANPQAVPEGFVLVPMVPSERMINAVRQCYEGEAYLPYSLYSEFVNQAIIERMEAQEPTND